MTRISWSLWHEGYEWYETFEGQQRALSLSHLYEITHAQQASSSAGPKKTLKLVVSCPSFSKWMGSTGGRR